MEHVATRPQAWLTALFGVYLVLVVWVVLWKLEVPYVGTGDLRVIKLVPFAPSSGAGASNPVEAVANVVLFVPFGIYLGLIAPFRPWWGLAAVAGAASLVLEIAQFILAIGSSDITDLVTNTAGSLVGLSVLSVARRALSERAETVMTRVCSIVTLLLLVAAGLFVASPLRHAPPRDADIPVVSGSSD